MKERTRRIDAEPSRESDGGIVPKKQPNKATPEAAEVVEGRPPEEEHRRESHRNDTEPKPDVLRT